MGFLRLVLNAVHFVLALWTYFMNILGTAIKTLNLIPQKQSLTKIQNDSRCLKKLPLHIGLVFVEENICFTDVANMLVWSMAMGITYISLYDRFGNIKRRKDLIERNLALQGEKALGQDVKKYDVNVNSSKCGKRSDGGCNGLQIIDITLLSVEDGMQNLASFSRKIANSILEGKYKLEDISPSNVDVILQEECKFPDPDLVLCFGPRQTLMGFLPWQIRLSEILHLPTHKNMKYKDFHRAVISYGDTKQRFGK